jgi:hypothetical protein
VLTTLSLVFLGLTGAVLLIVCLNLASVLVARGEARRREFAIRLALGGGRARIIRQLLVEALLVGGVASIGGVLIGVPAIRAFIATLVSRVPIALVVDAGDSGAVTAGAFAFGLVASVVFALGPAITHSRDRDFVDLKHQLGDTAPTRRRWVRSPLVAAQVALSLALLVAAGLFVRLAQDGTTIETGLADAATVLADVDASLAGYDEARALPLYAAIEARLAALPGGHDARAGRSAGHAGGGPGLRREVERRGGGVSRSHGPHAAPRARLHRGRGATTRGAPGGAGRRDSRGSALA